MRTLHGGLCRFAPSLLVCAIAVTLGGAAKAVNFNTLAHGEIAGILDGVTISAVNFNPNLDYDFAVGFDTRERGTRDPDLEAAKLEYDKSHGGTIWSGGNIRNEKLNVILVIQENNIGCWDGVCDYPDDEARRPAGNLIFDFDVPLLDFGFDVVDVENATAENGMVSFFVDDDDVAEATVEFRDFVTIGSGFFDWTISYGDNTANRISPITAEKLGIDAFSRVIITMGGSGGVDNLAYTAVPEPGTSSLMILGLLLAGASRRR